MSSVLNSRQVAPGSEPIVYPTRDGRPLGETDVHRDIMNQAINLLTRYYAGQLVYVTGNLLVFYAEGDRHKHLSPDVLVVKGVAHYQRENYLIWEEVAAPNFVIEVTSASTKKEDLEQKFQLYRDILRVREYFLFDPKGEYLTPPLQGYRLTAGVYQPIAALNGRCPSLEIGLHLERVGKQLKFYSPATKSWLLTDGELVEEQDAIIQEKDAKLAEKDMKLERTAEDNVRLRQELERLRRLVDPHSSPPND